MSKLLDNLADMRAPAGGWKGVAPAPFAPVAPTISKPKRSAKGLMFFLAGLAALWLVATILWPRNRVEMIPHIICSREVCNVRAEAAPDAPIIATLRRGDAVVLPVKPSGLDRWVRVTLPSGQEGYVSSRVSTRVDRPGEPQCFIMGVLRCD